MSIMAIHIVLWAGAFALLASGATTDFHKRIIPDRIVVQVAIIGVMLTLLLRPEQVWIGFATALVVFVPCALLARLRLLGGGDAKLISAVTLLVPPERVGALLLAIVLSGGVVSAVYVAAYAVLKRKRVSGLDLGMAGPRGSFSRLLRNERIRIVRARCMPYGVAIFLGVGVIFANETITCYSATSCSP